MDLELGHLMNHADLPVPIQGWADKYKSLVGRDFNTTVDESLEHNVRWLKGPGSQLCKWLAAKH